MESVLKYIFSTQFIVAVLRMSTPLILCSMGVLLVRKSGIVCIAFESMMLAAAFGGVIGSAYAQSLAVGMLCGVGLKKREMREIAEKCKALKLEKESK